MDLSGSSILLGWRKPGVHTCALTWPCRRNCRPGRSLLQLSCAALEEVRGKVKLLLLSFLKYPNWFFFFFSNGALDLLFWKSGLFQRLSCHRRLPTTVLWGLPNWPLGWTTAGREWGWFRLHFRTYRRKWCLYANNPTWRLLRLLWVLGYDPGSHSSQGGTFVHGWMSNDNFEGGMWSRSVLLGLPAYSILLITKCWWCVSQNLELSLIFTFFSLPLLTDWLFLSNFTISRGRLYNQKKGKLVLLWRKRWV